MVARFGLLDIGFLIGTLGQIPFPLLKNKIYKNNIKTLDLEWVLGSRPPLPHGKAQSCRLSY